MIEQKLTTAKTYRIDNRIVSKLNILSQATGRSQVELIEIALKSLFADNALYFIEDSVIERVFDSSRVEFSIAGLYFDFEYNVLLIYTKHVNQKTNSIALEILETSCVFLESQEIASKFKTKIDRTLGSGKILYDVCFLHPDGKDNFVSDLHEILSKIDVNYYDMQEWIKSEFDFT